MREAPYAWVVVWATFFALAIIFGVSYSFAAFFASFAGEFDAQALAGLEAVLARDQRLEVDVPDPRHVATVRDAVVEREHERAYGIAA